MLAEFPRDLFDAFLLCTQRTILSAQPRSVSMWARKAVLWFFWGINTVASAVYAALAITNARNLGVGYFDRNLKENNAINGLLAACVLSFVGVVAFGVMSLLVLAVRNVRGRSMKGFWYGTLLSSSLHLAMLLLLSGLVLNAFSSTVDGWRNSGAWSDLKQSVFYACFILAYILAGGFLLIFGLLWICKTAFVDLTASTPTASSLASVTGKVEKSKKSDQIHLNAKNAIV